MSLRDDIETVLSESANQDRAKCPCDDSGILRTVQHAATFEVPCPYHSMGFERCASCGLEFRKEPGENCTEQTHEDYYYAKADANA